MNSIKIKLYGNNSVSMLQRVVGIFARHNLQINHLTLNVVDSLNSDYLFVIMGDSKRIELAIRQLNRVVGLQILQKDNIN